MRIGVPKEIKNSENRVSITPAGVMQLVSHNHQVFIEKNAGMGAGFSDEEYQQVGAVIVETAKEAWDQEMVLKVKEPIKEEYQYFREGLILFTYLHLAAEPELTKELMEKGVIAIAYETVETSDRRLPLLTPMSEVAGRMSVVIGATYLLKHNGGKGMLLSGVPGTPRANVVIIGAGIAGLNAAKMAIGMEADVTLLDINLDKLRYIDDIYGRDVQTLYSNTYNIAKSVKNADLLIGAVLIPGAKAPKLVTEEMVKQMKPGSVIVDIAIDQGGCVETIDHPTTHMDPVYIKHGVVHYAVANIPGAASRTSTLALTNATLAYTVNLANLGFVEAIKQDPRLAKGVNIYKGKITYKAVAEAMKMDYTPLETLL